MNEICHTLLEAAITLYPADADGRPLVDFPIWSGAPAHQLTLTERWIKQQTRPTGARYPRNHPLVAQYEIAIGRVWALPLPNLLGFQSDGERYVLDIVWTDEDEGQWHRKTFYGVTLSERTQASPETDREFSDNQTFDAEYFVSAVGTGSVPAIADDLPYLIRYVTAQGGRFIYSYNPATHAFTELVSGLADQTAVVGYISGAGALLYNSETLYSNSLAYRNEAAFRVRFSGADDDALRMRSDGTVEVAATASGAPARDSLPRVDFCYGGRRLASISRNGKLYAWAYETEAAEEISAGFEFFNGATLLATITQKAIRAPEFVTV
ncbi:MAG: hypothetical protein ACTHLW_21150 [Verrucomicrobiota bacterium]